MLRFQIRPWFSVTASSNWRKVPKALATRRSHQAVIPVLRQRNQAPTATPRRTPTRPARSFAQQRIRRGQRAGSRSRSRRGRCCRSEVVLSMVAQPRALSQSQPVGPSGLAYCADNQAAKVPERTLAMSVSLVAQACACSRKRAARRRWGLDSPIAPGAESPANRHPIRSRLQAQCHHRRRPARQRRLPPPAGLYGRTRRARAG